MTILGAIASADEGKEMETKCANIPDGYTLQCYDDCGVPGRQPHVQRNAAHTFAPASVDAPLKSRTVTYGTPHFDMVFEELAQAVPHVLAVTYASERGNRRVQSLKAGTRDIHGPLMLPDGAAERLVYRIPNEAIDNGRLVLHFICEEGHNAVASVAELWAPLPGRSAINMEVQPRVTGILSGRVADLAYEGIPGVSVCIRDTLSNNCRQVSTDDGGSFTVDLSEWAEADELRDFEVSARQDGLEAKAIVFAKDLRFSPLRFVPTADRVRGTRQALVLLDGTWRINRDPEQALCDGTAEGPGWRDFVVPGQWLQQDVDVPRDKPVAIVRRFEAPKSWRDKRVFLRFDAVHGSAEYWLNGSPLGASEHLFTPVEFEVTDHVQFGISNVLALKLAVDSPSESLSYSSAYAFHNLGGIDRSVRLFVLPDVHLARFHTETRLDQAYRDAVLRLELSMNNATKEPASNLALRVSLDEQGAGTAPVGRWGFSLAPLPAGETALVRELSVKDPVKWSAEKPALYALTVELLENGKTLECLRRNVGFRSVEVRGNLLLVNGKSVKLRGVNRHEIDPLTGRAATAEHAEEDARLLRDANFNFIRTAHYPPTAEFLDACDRLGIYVECEAPFCWVRGGRGEDDPALTRHFLAPTSAMIDYYRDHPSIILWSLGNESGNGPDGANCLPENFAATAELCRAYDPSRPIVFNNEWARDGGACDIAIVHYPPFPPEKYAFVEGDKRPILLDEYFPPQTFTFAEELRINPGLDVVNWSTGQNSANSYWSQLYTSPRTLGGAIWAAIDEEFIFADGQVKGYGPWGFVDVWRRPKSLWWDAKRIHSPVWIPIRAVAYEPGQDTVRIPVENRNTFTDLSEINVGWELGRRKGHCHATLPPQANGEIEVPIPKDTAEGSLLVLRFTDSQKKLITAHGVRLGKAPVTALPSPSAGCPEFADDGRMIRVRGNDFAFALDRSTGEIRCLSDDGGIRLRRFPTLFVSRKETKNVFNPGGLPYAQYPEESTHVVDDTRVEQIGDALALTVRDHYKAFAGHVRTLLDKTGQALVTFEYTYSGDAFPVSEWGVRLVMDQDCQTITWRRQTEWDVYPKDHLGRPEGHANARMPKKWREAGFAPYQSEPPWPWHLDMNELGTRDFRTTKYTVYDAQLLAEDGSGFRVDSDATNDVRACLGPDCVYLHILESQHPAEVADGTPISGRCRLRFLSGER